MGKDKREQVLADQASVQTTQLARPSSLTLVPDEVMADELRREDDSDDGDRGSGDDEWRRS